MAEKRSMKVTITTANAAAIGKQAALQLQQKHPAEKEGKK